MTATISRWMLRAATLLLFCSGAFAGDSWWEAAWTTRKKVTIDTTSSGANVSEPIGSSVVLLRLYEANFGNGFGKEDLGDLRFVAEDDKTVLPHHVEKVDAVLLEAFVWVKVPDLKPNEKRSFWLYFGSADPKAVKAEDAKACYDVDTVLVFHFAPNGAPASDATKNGNAAGNAGGKVEGSCIASGVSFNGKDTVTIPTSSTITWVAGAPVTVSAWVKATAFQPQANIVSRTEEGKSFILGMANGVPFVELNNQRAAAATPLTASAWAHLAVVCEGSKTTLFVNGEPAGTAAVGMPALDAPVILGGTGFTGEIDELQIHRAARPAGFIKFAALSQNGDAVARTITFSAQEQPTNWLSWLTTGHFGIIVKNLTFDGWVVIVLLAIMAVMSWYVMVSKTRYLNGITKGNNLFMKHWREVVSDLTILDGSDAENSRTLGGRMNPSEGKTMRKSSVYRIYHIGVEEVRHRIEQDRSRGVERGLAGRSIQAVRASLDGGMVHETQKLNKLIVLLTICISGGPFLGLLGTVVGVMITFAAVAEAGEVNVNAIAPGIAAALLATVAGLAVAIPSLFGYNYILSRVKDAKDDMHVFIDEFVTRMAEFYKEKNN